MRTTLSDRRLRRALLTVASTSLVTGWRISGWLHAASRAFVVRGQMSGVTASFAWRHPSILDCTGVSFTGARVRRGPDPERARPGSYPRRLHRRGRPPPHARPRPGHRDPRVPALLGGRAPRHPVAGG